MLLTLREQVRYTNFSIGHLPETEYETLPQLRKAVFEVIIQRLKKRKIASSLITETALSWCLPVS